METIHLPGLNEEISKTERLFIDDEMICSLDWHLNDSMKRSYYAVYSKAQQTTNQVGACDCKNCERDRWHTDGSTLYIDGCRKDWNIPCRAKHPQKSCKRIEKDLWNFHSYKLIGHLMIENKLDRNTPDRKALFLQRESYITVPDKNYFASFTHSDNNYLISCNPLEATLPNNYSYSNSNTKKTFHPTISAQGYIAYESFPLCEAHVISNTVFLLSSSKKQLYKLDLTTYKFEVITNKVPIMQQGNAFAFHDKYLYATNPSQPESMYRLDLTIPIDEAMNTKIEPTPTAIVSVAPSTMSLKCGHSFNGNGSVEKGFEQKTCSIKTVIAKTDKNSNSSDSKGEKSEDRTTSNAPDTNAEINVKAANSNASSKSQKQDETEKSNDEPDSPASPLQCQFCLESLTESKTFNCEFCAEKENKLEVFVCGTCVVKSHGDHFTSVKSVIFADSAYRSERIGHITRDPEIPGNEETALNAEMIHKVAAELTNFFSSLKIDYETVNNQVTRLLEAASISQKAMDKEVEKILCNEAIIETKIQKLEDWKKEVYECFSKLNKQ